MQETARLIVRNGPGDRQVRPITTPRMWDYILGPDWTELIETEQYKPMWDGILANVPPGTREILVHAEYEHGTKTAEELRTFMDNATLSEKQNPPRQLIVISYMDNGEVSYAHLKLISTDVVESFSHD